MAIQPSYTWSTVKKVSGNSIQRTQSFHVKAPWRIVWTTASGGFSYASVEHAGQMVNPFATVAGKDSGIDYEYVSGTFDLNIEADEQYTVTVQQGR